MVSVILSLGTVDSAEDLLIPLIPASEVLEIRTNIRVWCDGEKCTIFGKQILS